METLSQAPKWKFGPSQSSKGFIPVLLMPYLDDLSIDFEGLDRLVDLYVRAGAVGIFANCFSTEVFHLSADERLAHIRRVVKRVYGTLPVVATGWVDGGLREQADEILRIAESGVTTVVILSNQLAGREESDEVWLDRFNGLLAMTPDVSLGLYECPRPYRRVVSPHLLQEVLKLGRLHYFKDTCCDSALVLEKLAVLREGGCALFDAHIPQAVSSLRGGAAGLSAVAGNFVPEILAWLCAHVQDPLRRKDVEWIQVELKNADALIHTAYPVSAKYFLQLRGLPITRRSRFLDRDLTDGERRAIECFFVQWQGWCERLGIEPFCLENASGVREEAR
jgi:4-hydroxy-tetrahydrodipicolinate synthase